MALAELYKGVLHHLVQGDYRKAMETLQPPTDVEKLLDIIFIYQGGNSRRRVSQDAMLKFVESLPYVEWIIYACTVMLRGSGNWDPWAVALVLRRAMSRSTGTALVKAEIAWIKHLNFVSRAVASGVPITITSAGEGDNLYVAGDGYAHDKNNRSVFCWKGEWTADKRKELWRFVPAQTGSSDFYIVSVYDEGHLYASNTSVSSDADGFCLKRVLLRRGNDLPDASGIWRLVNLDGEDICTLYNSRHDIFLSSPLEASDGSRRNAVTSIYHPLDIQRSKIREWKIIATAPSMMEKGLIAFYSTEYEKAVKIFTSILATDISTAGRAKITHYRLIANVMLNNEGSAKQDFELGRELGTELGMYPCSFLYTVRDELADEERGIFEQRLVKMKWLLT